MSHALTPDGRVFIFGGYDSLRRRLNDLHCLHLPSNTWSKIEIVGEQIPPKLTYTAMALWQESRAEEESSRKESADKDSASTLSKLLLCGGYDGHTARKECFEFDIENSSWSRLGDLPILKEAEEEGEEDLKEDEVKRGRWKEEQSEAPKEEDAKRSRKREEEHRKSKGKEEEEREEEQDVWGLSEHQSIVVPDLKCMYLIGGLVDTNFLHPHKIVKVDLNRTLITEETHASSDGREERD